MVTISRYQGGTSLPAPNAPTVNVDTSMARGAQAVGNALQNAGAAFGDVLMRQQKELDEFKLRKGIVDFSTQQESALLERTQTMQPGAEGFARMSMEDFNKAGDQFLAQMPESVRQEAEVRLATLRNTFTDRAARAEYGERTRYYTNSVNEAADNFSATIRQNPGSYQDALAQVNELIDTAGLPAVNKAELKQQWARMAANAWAETLPPEERKRLFGAGPQSAEEGAANLLREFEGFREGAYWDVNAFRSGYGSDTVTRADGRVERVTRDTKVSRADAERDLTRRLGEFRQQAVSDVGEEAWSRLPPNIQSALLSTTYNYGEIPARIRGEIRSGDPEKIARAVESLGGDNGGINRKRRAQEAAVIRGQQGIGRTVPDEYRDRYDAMTVSDMEKLAASADRDIAAQSVRIKDGMALQIQTDPLSVTVEQIAGIQGIDDGDKAALITSLRKAQKEYTDGRAAVDWFNSDAQGNPLDTEDRKVADAAYSQLLTADVGAQQAGEQIAARKGVIPKEYVNEVRNGLNSQNIQTLTEALSRADRLVELNRQAVEGAENGGDLLKASAAFRHYTDRLGLSQDEAARRYADANDPEKVRQREALLDSKMVKDKVKTIDEAHVRDRFDPGVFGFDPKLGEDVASSAAMVADYRDMYQESVVEAGGDLDLADDLATQKFKRLYGVSQLSVAGDGVVTKLPPEITYPPLPDGSHSYLRTQALQSLKDEGVEATNVMFQALPDTERAFNRGQVAPYAVFYERDGKIEQFPYPFVGDPEGGLAEYQARIAAERAANVERARRVNEARRAQEQQRQQIIESGGRGPDPISEVGAAANAAQQAPDNAALAAIGANELPGANIPAPDERGLDAEAAQMRERALEAFTAGPAKPPKVIVDETIPEAAKRDPNTPWLVIGDTAVGPLYLSGATEEQLRRRDEIIAQIKKEAADKDAADKRDENAPWLVWGNVSIGPFYPRGQTKDQERSRKKLVDEIRADNKAARAEEEKRLRKEAQKYYRDGGGN